MGPWRCVTEMRGFIYIRNKLVKRLISRVQRAARSAAVGMLALTLLAPILEEMVSFEATQSSCGMSCCKSGKTCSCCRHSRRRNLEGAQWTAASQCSGKCGQLASLPNWPGVHQPAVSVPVIPARIETPRRRLEQFARTPANLESALFQRPPPESAPSQSST